MAGSGIVQISDIRREIMLLRNTECWEVRITLRTTNGEGLLHVGKRMLHEVKEATENDQR